MEKIFLGIIFNCLKKHIGPSKQSRLDIVFLFLWKKQPFPIDGSLLNFETIPCLSAAGTLPSNLEKVTDFIWVQKSWRSIRSSMDLCWQKIKALCSDTTKFGFPIPQSVNSCFNAKIFGACSRASIREPFFSKSAVIRAYSGCARVKTRAGWLQSFWRYWIA